MPDPSTTAQLLARFRGRLSQPAAAEKISALLPEPISWQALGRIERGDTASIPADFVEAALVAYGCSEGDKKTVRESLLAPGALVGGSAP
jgi:hypothetical protein